MKKQDNNEETNLKNGKIFTNYTSNEGLIFKIHKKQNNLITKKQLKMDKY